DLLYLTVSGSDPSGRDRSTGGADAGEDGVADDRGPLETLHLSGGERGLELVAHLEERKDRSRPLKRALTRAGGTSIVVNWPMVHVHTAEDGGTDDARKLLDALDAHGVVDLRVEDLSVRSPDGDPAVLIALAEGPGLLLSLALSDAVAVHSGRSDLREAVADLVALAEAPVFILPDSAAAADAVSGLDEAKVLRTRDVASV